ncbi:UNVERIFIED_CONTAM: hypothetical protein GTU68_058933 [Idotea baltica]|nr:hypothetical protein [Idotea baltica]
MLKNSLNKIQFISLYEAKNILSINSKYKLKHCRIDRYCQISQKSSVNKLNLSYLKVHPSKLRIFSFSSQTLSTVSCQDILRTTCCCSSIINFRHYHQSFVRSSNFDQGIPRTSEELKEVFDHDPVSPQNSKLLKVAIIGVPNSGKSTLINQLIGWRVCSVSQKVHTTQCNARAVSNSGSTQLVFLDTPGIVSPEEIKKYRLKHSLAADPELSLHQADLIAVLQDVSNSYTRNALHPRILRLLTLYPSIPSVLILNKVDLLKNKKLLLSITNTLTDSIVSDVRIHSSPKHLQIDETSLRNSLLGISPPPSPSPPPDVAEETGKERDPALVEALDQDTRASLASFDEVDMTLEVALTGETRPTEKQVQRLISGRRGWPRFSEVFMVSALSGEGLADIKEYLLTQAKDHAWMYSDDVITDQSPQEIALSAVREKCLNHLSHNVPYELQFKLLYWDLSDGEF